jgi:hypothetical protein
VDSSILAWKSLNSLTRTSLHFLVERALMLRTGRRSRVSPITHFISRHGGVVTKSYSECFKSPGTVSYGEVNRQFLPCNDLNNLARLMDTHLNPKYYICERWEPDLNCACVGSWTLYYYSSRTILDSPLLSAYIRGSLYPFMSLLHIRRASFSYLVSFGKGCQLYKLQGARTPRDYGRLN